MLLDVDNFGVYNFLYSITNTIPNIDPCHLIFFFELFSNAFLLSKSFDQEFHVYVSLEVNISKILI